MLPLPLLLLLLLIPCALAAPPPPPGSLPVHVPLARRTTSPEDRVARLPLMMDAIRIKYGFKPVNRKRAAATSVSLTDETNDSSYSASVSIGTPAQKLNLILDTGSSDLWVATSPCSTCDSSVPLFNAAKSSSFKNASTSLQLDYGSGSAIGDVAQESVSFSGFTMSQEMLAVSQTTSNLLSDGLSGIMGLGFESISSLQTTPFWQTLYNQNDLSSPVFSFYLERHLHDQPTDTSPGGTFTLGGTNTSLYSGNIEFTNMPSGSTPGYWLQQVSSISIQGKSISVSSTQGLAAIDTGTTLIAAPPSLVQQIWSTVPGSVPLSGGFEGMYAFPCSTTVSVSISFGGTHWPISSTDMNLGTVSGSGSSAMCAGAIFNIGNTIGGGGGGQDTPSWIVGDAFLKNVYTVFRANPPSVGFATLANGLNGSSSSGVPLSSGSSSSSSGASCRRAVSSLSFFALSMLALFGFGNPI